jgi:hypothetical protein
MLAFVFALLCGGVGLAGEIVTDANVATALDISDSVGADDLELEIEGIAEAIRSPEFLAAIQSGRHGRIGFAMFAWHHSQFPEVVPWRLIASEEDAAAVAREIENRLHVNIDLEARRDAPHYIGRLTDLSRAIDHATELLETAPFSSERSIANIVGNGTDNVGEGAQAARDRSVAAGAIINGVVIGNDPLLLAYYRRQVIGGPGAFAISTIEAATIAEAMRRKFIHDIALAMPNRGHDTTTVDDQAAPTSARR